jgi:hypothetical protein
MRISQIGKFQDCNLPLAKARQQEGDYRSILLPLLEKLQVPIFDPFTYFCDDLQCRIINGQKILSLDGGHMSRYGTEFLIEHGKSAIDTLLLN